MLLILLNILFLVISATYRSKNFPPGWNKLAVTPPLGWRSWNAFGNRVSQKMINATIDALTAPVWTIDSKNNVSLAQAGYKMVGIDEGWEGCGEGINNTQHDAKGNPVINSKFPDMMALVQYGHAKGLKMGWYENGCACGEKHELLLNYQGDVRMLHQLGFDGVKLDGCGAQRNMTLYASLMNTTNKAYLIENCHWGRCNNNDDSSCPTVDWCPFNWYRTSGDINSSPMSWYANLQTTTKFQDPKTPLSRPNCWAYPDMLEVGRINVDGKMHLNWNRAHFGAWCIISSPLILGLDVTKVNIVAPIINIITNPEAIAVSQTWAGHPGGLVWSQLAPGTGFPSARVCNASDPAQRGWVLQSLGTSGKVAVKAPGGGCMQASPGGYPGGRGHIMVAPCNSSSDAQAFIYNASIARLAHKDCVDVHGTYGPLVWLYGCNVGNINQQLHFITSNQTLCNACGTDKQRCFAIEPNDPAGETYQSTLQVWAKPLNDNTVAVLFINPTRSVFKFTIPISSLPFTDGVPKKEISVRDIWDRQNLRPLPVGVTNISISVNSLDSAFLHLS